MNTRGKGQIPAKLRSTGNKGSKKKEQISTLQFIQFERDQMNMKRLERAVKDVEKSKAKNNQLKHRVLSKIANKKTA